MVGGTKRLARFELLGALFIVLAGTPLHYLYSSTGSPAVAWLGPINESTWEHFKLAFWPGLLWTAFEFVQLPANRKGIWTAKLVSLFAMPVTIVVLFYSYTGLLGYNVLALDIATFVVSVVVGQWLGYKTWVRARVVRGAAMIVALMAVAFIYFSYSPPAGFLFDDPRVQSEDSRVARAPY